MILYSEVVADTGSSLAIKTCIVLRGESSRVRGAFDVQGVVTIFIGMFTMRLQFKGRLQFKVWFLFKEIRYVLYLLYFI